MAGGRVRSIADKLCISQHTVKNHLRNIFAKLGVSSQQALIAFTRDNPGVIGHPSNGDSVEQLIQQDEENERKVIADIIAILGENEGKSAFKKMFRAIMPVDKEQVDFWRLRVKLWALDLDKPEAFDQRIDRMKLRRQTATERIQRLQQEGVINNKLAATEITGQLYSITSGAVLEILRNPGPETIDNQLTALDDFIDNICC